MSEKKRTISVVDFRDYSTRCSGTDGKECFMVEKIVNSVMFVAGSMISKSEVQRLIGKDKWVVNVRMPKSADFSS